MSFLVEAARRGERGVVYTFEEEVEGIILRCEAIGLEVRSLIERDLLRLEKVNPLVLYPDQFAAWVRAEVEQKGTRLLLIDSLNGYRQVMPDEDFLVTHMHQLASYLNRMGVVTILTNELATLTGGDELTEYGLSHLVDTVLLLKFFEFEGGLRIAAGAIKRRLACARAGPAGDGDHAPGGPRGGDSPAIPGHPQGRGRSPGTGTRGGDEDRG